MTNHSARLARTLIAAIITLAAFGAVAAPTFAKTPNAHHQVDDRGRGKGAERHDQDNGGSAKHSGDQDNDGGSAYAGPGSASAPTLAADPPSSATPSQTAPSSGSGAATSGGGSQSGTPVCYVDVGGFVSLRLVRDPNAQYLPTSNPGDGTSWRLTAPETDCGASTAQ